MTNDTKHTGKNSAEATDSDLITYTQVGCCAVENYTTRAQRLSLRARLEREREERAQRRQVSFISTFRNLLGTSRH